MKLGKAVKQSASLSRAITRTYRQRGERVPAKYQGGKGKAR